MREIVSIQDVMRVIQRYKIVEYKIEYGDSDTMMLGNRQRLIMMIAE